MESREQRDPELGERPEANWLAYELAQRRVTAQLLGLPVEPLRVDRFVLEDELGSGGMGTVWRAYDDQLDRPVALKFLRSETVGELSEQRLLEEAQSLAQLSHPNVIPVYDVGRHRGRVWVAMEFVRGQTLRSWAREASRSQLLDAWLDVGRGLAAMHAIGLIHRDVKPDNVMVGDDGRVRLIDFGLVRALPSDPAIKLERTQDSTERSSTRTRALTLTGAFLGTPSYAAPEQRECRDIDHRADQYAFCVSVWETLCGARPTREPASDPARLELPRRIRLALLRGLSSSPDQRFADMPALLDELAPRRSRRVVSAVLGAALVGLAGGLSFVNSADDPCPLPQTWAPTLRTQLHDRLEATGPDWAAAVLAPLDDWAAAWASEQQSACQDTRVHGRYSEAALDLRSTCLAQRQREFMTAVDVLGSGTITRPEQAAAIIDSLPAPRRCANVDQLGRGPRAPEQPAKVEALRDEIVRLEFQRRAGGLDRLADRATLVVHEAEQLGYPPLQAEALALRGRIALERGQLDGGVADLEAGLGFAEASRHDHLAAEIWTSLALELANSGERPVDRERALPRARAAIERLDDARDPLWLELARAEAKRFEADERWPEEIETLTRALELAVGLGLANDIPSAALLHRRAVAYAKLGDGEHASEDFEQADARIAARWGRHNATYARLLFDRAQLEIETLGHVEVGREQLERARSLYIELGVEGPDLAWVEVALAQAAYLVGDYVGAERAMHAGYQQLERSLGPQHTDTLMVLGNLGVVRFRLGDYAGAREAFERALADQRALLSPDHPELGRLEGNLGETLLAEGQPRAALEHLELARTLLERSQGPDDTDLPPVLKSMGLAELGQLVRARELLERALAIHDAQAGADPAEVAEVCWGLARVRAQIDPRDTEVDPLATRAASLWRELDDPREAEVRAWLAARTSESAD